MRIGKELQAAREKAGLSQQALADKAGVHRVYISQLEGDKKSPTLEVLGRICAALDIPASKLLWGAEKRSRKL